MPSWRRALTIGALALGLGPVGLTADPPALGAQGGELAPPVPFCQPATGAATPDPTPLRDRFAAPPGAPATELLAVGFDVAIPPPDKGNGLVLTLYRLTLAPGAESTTFSAPGPILLLPETGSFDLAVNGLPVRLESGTCLLIELGATYTFFNGSGAPATVLRLALTPAGRDNPIGVPDVVTITPAPGETPAPYQIGITAARLVHAELVAPSRGTLVVARLTPAADAGAFHHPGSIALLAEQGEALLSIPLLSQEQPLAAPACVALPPDLPYRLARVADAASSLLLVGALRERDPLWLPGDPPTLPAAPSPLPRVDCGGDAQAA